MWRAESLVMRLPDYSGDRPERTRKAVNRLGMSPDAPKKTKPKNKPAKETEVKTDNTFTKSRKHMHADVSSLNIKGMSLQIFTDESNNLDDVLFFPIKSNEIQKALQKLSCDKKSCKAVDLCKVFGYPATFEHASELVRIGKPSLNGFIHEIRYRRSVEEGTIVESTAVLKSSQERYADNLVYE